MLKLGQLKLPVFGTEAEIRDKIIKTLRLKSIFKGDIPGFSFEIIRRSIDARAKPDIRHVYSLALCFDDDEIERYVLMKNKNNRDLGPYERLIYTLPECGMERLSSRPVIIGAGPAGLFAAYALALKGFKPLIIERGSNVDRRSELVDRFWQTGELDKNCNVQFGEGGAGTFSDGKLNTLVRDPMGRNQFVLDTFVSFGAAKECAYDAKSHVGTDVLKNVVKNMRNEIISLGGDFIFDCLMTDIICDSLGLKAVTLKGYREPRIDCECLILAIGHSSRDTFEMLKDKPLSLKQKNFAVGVRIEHPQEIINEAQYGKDYDKRLPAADYKLTHRTSKGRSVYSFCMCPGGYVVNASSEDHGLAVNGMSYRDRGSGKADSAIIVSVDERDFKSSDPLAGMYFQRMLEERAYREGMGFIPAESYGDFKRGEHGSKLIKAEPLCMGKASTANLRNIFPEEITDALIESIDKFSYTIQGFSSDDAILTAVESRTSSPVRIERDENFESGIKGVYPCGEGAGYAGGITSAAMDGLKVAEAIIKKYSP